LASDQSRDDQTLAKTSMGIVVAVDYGIVFAVIGLDVR
jgi:hypothetical protein